MRVVGLTSVHRMFAQLPTKHVIESRHTQRFTLGYFPVTTTYSPDGRTLFITSAGRQVHIMTLGRRGDDVREIWIPSEREPVRRYSIPSVK